MGGFFSSISARMRECGSVFFLFAPLGGLVFYTILFNITKPSPLLLAGSVERISASLTVLFFAFALSVVLMVLLSSALILRNKLGERIAKGGTLFVFAAASTLFAVIAIENFSYTAFRIGIKTTDGVLAKSLYLALALGLFSFFWTKGEAFRAKTRNVKMPILNAMIAVSAVAAAYNLAGNTSANAAMSLTFHKPYNIIILSSDGIDAGRTSLYGYERKTTPFLDSIANELLVARNAYPNNGNTTGAVTALLTGMLPTTTKVVFPPDSLRGQNAFRSLPRMLRQQGYYTNNIAVPHYADAAEQNLLGAFDVNNNRNMISSSIPVTFTYKTTNWLFDRLLSEAIGITEDVLWVREMPNPYSQVDGLERGFNYGNNDMKRLQSLLGMIRNADGPFFINSHFLGTHGPYFNPPLRKFASPSANKGQPWHRDLYDDAVLSFDMYVKRVYTALKDRGLLENTIIVVMSDHGISHDPRKKIPLMIRFPNGDQAGRIIEENVQVIDIAPTLIDFLGGKKPSWMEGRNLRDTAPPADRHIFSAGVNKIAFVPGVGVIGNDQGRFGTMDYFFMIHCGSQYRLDVNDGSFEVSRDPDGSHGCTPGQLLDDASARAVMTKHLDERY
jgi:arylsulfatase A-like enzyme